MNADGTGFYTCKEHHETESHLKSLQTTTDHKEGEQLEDRRNVGGSSCISGDGTDQRVQSLMFMMMMMMTQPYERYQNFIISSSPNRKFTKLKIRPKCIVPFLSGILK
jgi:hypothetical protein